MRADFGITVEDTRWKASGLVPKKGYRPCIVLPRGGQAKMVYEFGYSPSSVSQYMLYEAWGASAHQAQNYAMARLGGVKMYRSIKKKDGKYVYKPAVMREGYKEWWGVFEPDRSVEPL